MKTSTSPIKILRAALLLLTLLLPAAAAMATDFITDVMVVGNKNQTDFNSLINSLVSAGWTDINYDLNSGSGSGTDYIHLLFKKQSSSGNTGTPITDFYIRTGNNPPSSLTHEGRTYYLVPYDGSTSFINSQGDLNNNAGGAYIHLYYTKDALTNNHGVTGISFNTSQSGAVGENGGSTGYDLNSGAGGAYIYMHLATTSGGNVVTLTSGSGNVQLLNGHILTGTGGADTQVSVTDGATVTLSGVTLTAIANNNSHSWPGINCSGNATIVLNGGTTNSVSGGYRSPGIHVAATKALTIQGNGTLTATGRDYAAGIGSGQSQSSCGNITISGGTVTAAGGQNATGIGSGAEQQSCGNITISGGTVNATGLTWAAGIGSGSQSSCGTITISGGTVTATGGLYAAAIGSGYQSSCGNITITNGVTRVTATKHNNSANSVGAGNNSSYCTVTIGSVQTGYITMSPFVTFPYTVHFNNNGGTGTMADQAFMYNVAQNLTSNTFTNWGHPFLGWATSANGPKVYNDGQSVSNLTQSAGATVTLYAKWAITVPLTSSTEEVLLQNGDTLTGTGGSNTRVKIADGATVTFSGVNNIAISNDSDHSWPGIHCLGNATIVLNEGTTNSVQGGYQSPGIYVAANKTLTIQGSGTLNATGQTCGAGIGSSENQSSCGSITINSGTVNANGGYYAAAIGSGRQSSCGDITINGGTVTANGEYSAAGIGSGYDHASCGDISINGGTVTANGGSFAAGIGSGYSQSSCGNITITNGVTRVTATKNSSNSNISTVGKGLSSTCGTVTIGNVQTGFITMSPFETYPYIVHFDANGGTGTMANQDFMHDVAQDLRNNTFTKAGWVFRGWATSATGPKVYNNEQSVSNLTDTIATVTLYAKWTPGSNHFSVNGDTCIIHTATGWDYFCDLLAENNNGFFTGKTVKLADSIAVTTMAGSLGHEFSGTFDGQSHILNVDYQNTESTVRTAPFSYVNGATIRNLIVAGSIAGTGHCAGIVGETGSSLSHITNCVSSVNVSGGNTAGISMGGKVEITGCVFNGKITGTGISAGFVGSYNNALVISNSLFAPQAGSSINGGTFYNGGGEITPVIVNSYYTTPLGTSQGKQAHSIVGGEHVTVAFHGQATAYNTSGISAYSVGMVYGSILYAGDGDTVSLDLSCTPPAGYVLNGYTTSVGSLTGTANPYTLAMPDAAVTIQALEQLTSVTYIDGDSTEYTRSDFTVLTGSETTLEAGWYVVNQDITYDSTLTLAGDVTLILCDGKTMTVTTDSGRSINGLFSLIEGYALTVYGQTLDSETAGILDVTNNDENNDAIELGAYTQHSGKVTVNDSNGVAINTWDDFTLNGGTVNATGSFGISTGFYAVIINGGTVNATGGGACISATDLIINGGTVNVSTHKGFGIDAINVTINGGTVNSTNGTGIGAPNVTINGGTVNATHGRGIEAYENVTINGGTVTTNQINSPTTTLGWSNLTDCITVGSFDHWSTFTVSVKSGQAFYYQNGGETVIISGTLNSDQINAIGEKTLRPLTPVSYVDGSGQTHTCDYYNVLTGNETTLEAGWYVVNQDITYDSTLTLNGNVTLILCNGKTMTVNPGSGNSISGNALTIYGQTLDSVASGTLQVFNNVENKIAIELITYTQHSGKVVVNDSNDFAISANGFTLNGGTVNVTGAYGISTQDMTLNGGTVNATGYYVIYANNVITLNGSTVNATGFHGIHANNFITINGGTVNATGDIYGINANGNVTINGGTVNATANLFGISSSVDIILGWTNPDDYILVNKYEANGIVSVKSGRAFYYEDGNETVIVSDTLNSDQIEAIRGKTLRPYIEPCTPPFHLEVSDISATTATLHWMGVQDSYIVRYRTLERAGEWVEATADTTTLNLTNLVPETLYEWQVRGVNTDCNGGVTDWSDPITFTTEELTTVTQSIALVEGWNWVSTYIEAEDPVELLQMLEAALGENGLTIKAMDDYTTYEDDEWGATGDLQEVYNEQMYAIEVSEDCTIEIVGMPAVTEGHVIDIYPGWNWIGFPCSQVLDLEDALSDFDASDGDVIKGMEDYSSYDDGWGDTGDMEELTPGQGYKYFSNSTVPKTLVFSADAKKMVILRGKRKE